MPSEKLKVMLCDDHDVMREGLRTMLNQQSGIEVVAEAGTGVQCLDVAAKNKPDLLIMDIGMPDMNGIDATREMARRCPETKVLCLSMHDERQMVISMLRAGAAGYLLKNCAGRELIKAIQAVMDGKKWISPAVSSDLVHEYIVGSRDHSDCICGELTEREREILQHIAEGRNTKEIADILHISDKTVAAHRLKLKEKIDCDSVADLTRYAIRNGLVNA